MVDLYKINIQRQIGKIENYPFPDEPNEFEDFIMKNEKLLGDVALINEQVKIPNDGIMDIWGVDLVDLRPIIVELKNVKTGLEIIPQILPYYKFVKSHPDTLKHKASLNEGFMHRIENMGKNRKQIDEGLEEDPKVILVAPGFKRELMDAVDYFNIEIELVEVSRYKTESDVIVAMNRPESEPSVAGKVTTRQEWNWDKFVEEGIAQKKIAIAKEIKDRLDKIVQDEKIDLVPIFRKLYVPYKHGRNIIFWVDLSYTSWETGDVGLVFKLDKEPDLNVEGINIEHTKTKWFADSNVWYIFFNKAVDLSPLSPIIKKSYTYVTQK